MLVDINPNMELPSYDLVLCKMSGEKISQLHNTDNKKHVNYFNSIDEFTFSVPMMISDNGTTVKNKVYDLIETDHLLLLNDSQYFCIDLVTEVDSADTGTRKEIHAYSLEYELGNKMIVNYDRVGRKLYTPPPHVEKDEDGFEIGILNYIETISSWKVARVESNLLNKERMLSFTSSNLLQVFQELQKAYSCLFRFDTIEKTIEVVNVDSVGQNKGLYISDENFIKNITKTSDSKEIKTRLIVKGKDDASIHSLNITGQPYIENYNFYKNEKYMSASLINGLNEYEDFLSTKQDVFNGYLGELETKQSTLDVLNNDLASLTQELKSIQNDIDIKIVASNGSNTSLTSLKRLETEKLNEIKTKEQEIKNNVNEQDLVRESIEQLKSEIDMSNFLTLEQVREFDSFIKEDVLLDTNYTEENIDELFEESKNILAKISQPKVTFDVDVFDFLSLVECQHIWKKLVTGDVVNLVHSQMGIDWQVRLISYVHSLDSNDLQLTFSNKDNIDDANMYIAELIEGMNTTSTKVDFSKYKWDKAEDAESTISQYINNELDLAKQSVLTAEGQRPILDDRGFWLYKENPDGSISDKQMRLINNTLAITNDNWNTVSTAVSGDGINAEVVRGKLGQFAQVQANQIVVGDNGATIPDEALGGSLVKQGEMYNKTKITTEEGIEVYNNANRKVLQMGAIDTTGNGIKNEYGFIAEHSDGSFSAMTSRGFTRKDAVGESYYLTSTAVITGKTTAYYLDVQPDPVRINLPPHLKNKDNKCFLTLTNFSLRISTLDDARGIVPFASQRTVLAFDVDPELTAKGDSPYVVVRGYTRNSSWGGTDLGNYYEGLEFQVMVVGG